MHHRLTLTERTQTEEALEEWQRELRNEQQLDDNSFGPDDFVPVHLGKQVEAIEMRADCTYAIEERRKPRVIDYDTAPPELRAQVDRDEADIVSGIMSWERP